MPAPMARSALTSCRVSGHEVWGLLHSIRVHHHSRHSWTCLAILSGEYSMRGVQSTTTSPANPKASVRRAARRRVDIPPLSPLGEPQTPPGALATARTPPTPHSRRAESLASLGRQVEVQRVSLRLMGRVTSLDRGRRRREGRKVGGGQEGVPSWRVSINTCVIPCWLPLQPRLFFKCDRLCNAINHRARRTLVLSKCKGGSWSWPSDHHATATFLSFFPCQPSHAVGEIESQKQRACTNLTLTPPSSLPPAPCSRASIVDIHECPRRPRPARPPPLGRWPLPLDPRHSASAYFLRSVSNHAAVCCCVGVLFLGDDGSTLMYPHELECRGLAEEGGRGGGG